MKKTNESIPCLGLKSLYLPLVASFSWPTLGQVEAVFYKLRLENRTYFCWWQTLNIFMQCSNRTSCFHSCTHGWLEVNLYVGPCIHLYVNIIQSEDRLLKGGVTRMHPCCGMAGVCASELVEGFVKEFSFLPWWPRHWPHCAFQLSQTWSAKLLSKTHSSPVVVNEDAF